MSADLFAAFGDNSQPPPQQNRPNPPSTQSPYTPFSFGSTLSPNNISNNSHRRSQSSSVLLQSQNIWQPIQPVPVHSRPLTPVAPSISTNTRSTEDDDNGGDDAWGDFEVAPSNASLPVPTLQTPAMTPSFGTFSQPLRPMNAAGGLQQIKHARASTVDWSSFNRGVFQTTPSLPTWPALNAQPVVKTPEPPAPPVPKAQPKPANTDPNVLFDADDFEGGQAGEQSDDDFGEFETVSPAVQAPPDLMSNALPVSVPIPVPVSVPSSSFTHVAKKPSDALLDLDFSYPSAPTNPQPIKPNPVPGPAAVPIILTPSPPSQELNKLAISSETVQSQKAPAHTRTPSWEDDWCPSPVLSEKPAKLPTKQATVTPVSDWAWESVETPKVTQPSKTPIKKTSVPQSKDSTATKDDSSWDWDPVEPKSEPVVGIEDTALPPVNIPPPSIILSAFPELIDQANDYLYKPVSKQPPAIKDRILSDPRVYDFLEGYLSLATVAARVIAGRRLRWHRDKFLSQSMSISASGSKGMKLAGVDKTQTVREDREAADVVSHWKGQVGRLRSTVAAANSASKSHGKQLKIPEITDTIHVQTVKGVPTALKACVICGLKRDERLTKIDYEVEDSFGEWWVDHWGHMACKRFWLQHENTLRQR